MSWNGINSCMLTVVYFSILQHKLVFLLPDDTSRVNYSVSVIKLDKANCLQTYFYCESENFNIIINVKLHLNFQSISAQSYVSAWFFNYFQMKKVLRSVHTRPSFSLSIRLWLDIADWTVCWTFLNFSMAFLEEKLPYIKNVQNSQAHILALYIYTHTHTHTFKYLNICTLLSIRYKSTNIYRMLHSLALY